MISLMLVNTGDKDTWGIRDVVIVLVKWAYIAFYLPPESGVRYGQLDARPGSRGRRSRTKNSDLHDG